MSERPPIAPAEPRQYKIKRVAKMLDLDERTIRRLIQRGELASIGRGRMRRIAEDDIRAWQRRNRNGGDDA